MSKLTAIDLFSGGGGLSQGLVQAGYDVVAELSGNSNTLDGYLAMKEIFRQHGDDLAVVFAENDRMAYRAGAQLECINQ